MKKKFKFKEEIRKRYGTSGVADKVIEIFEEFIKRLKEEIGESSCIIRQNDSIPRNPMKIINKLAGDELTNG